MGVLYGFLIVVEMLVSALLIAVIFMQKSKGGMGGSAFGGGAGEAIFGSRMGNVLTKATVVLGVIFLLNTLVLTVMTSRRGQMGSVMESAPRQAAPQPSSPSPGGMSEGWMESELQPGGEMPIEMPVATGEADVEPEVMVIPPVDEAATAAEVPMENPLPDADTSTAPANDAADLGE